MLFAEMGGGKNPPKEMVLLLGALAMLHTYLFISRAVGEISANAS